MLAGESAYVHSLQASYIDLRQKVIQSENVDVLTLSWITLGSTWICMNNCVINQNAPVQHMLTCSYCNKLSRTCPQETPNIILHRKRFDTKINYVFV